MEQESQKHSKYVTNVSDMSENMSGLYVTSVTYDNWRMMMKERNDRRMISQLAGTGPASKGSWLRAKEKF